jgi:WG containing repeat
LSSAKFNIDNDAPLFPVFVKGKWGYIDRSGRIVIEPQFHYASYFSEGLALVKFDGTSRDDRIFRRRYDGFIDPNGDVAIQPEPPEGVRKVDNYQFYSFADFHDGMARIHVNDASGVAGYVDRSGNLVVFPRYRPAVDFSEGLAYVCTAQNMDHKRKRRQGFINKEGTFEIEIDEMNYSSGFVDGRADVSLDSDEYYEPCGVIDRNGRFVIPPGIYDRLGCPNNGAIWAERKRKVGLLDLDGEVLVPFGLFNQIEEPYDGPIFVATTGKKTVLMFRNGQVIAEVAEKGDVDKFRSGFARIQRGEFFGYIDATGKTQIPVQFERAESFRLGLARVKIGDTTGYINSSGEFVWKTDWWEW